MPDHQDTVPDIALPFSWDRYIGLLIAARGSLSEVARCLLERAPPAARPGDPLTVERGLRRLRDRPGSPPGDKYGRLLLRCFGLPALIAAHARQLGQYHSRLSDLPIPVRREQLHAFDLPPLTESPAAAWIHLALASLAHRDGDLPLTRRRADLARLALPGAPPEARIEWLLLRARLCADAGDCADAAAALDQAGALLDAAPDTADTDDRACYRARLLDQRAWLCSRRWREDPGVLSEAAALYAAIPDPDAPGAPTLPPFTGFRRAHGLAWCRWRMGGPGCHTAALDLARAAARHAGDGGLLRLRCMSLRLQAHITQDAGQDAAPLWRRVAQIAERLGDIGLRQ